MGRTDDDLLRIKLTAEGDVFLAREVDEIGLGLADIGGNNNDLFPVCLKSHSGNGQGGLDDVRDPFVELTR